MTGQAAVSTLKHVEWPKTVWSEASQITSLLKWPRIPDDDVAPPRFFAALRASGRKREAARFLGLALPRYEAVEWAARVLAGHPPKTAVDRLTMQAVEEWLHEPSDAMRRAAADASAAIKRITPAKLCATAVFMSGGSVYPVGERLIPAPRQTTGKLAATAVLVAVYETVNPEAHLDAALDLGAAIAAREADLSS